MKLIKEFTENEKIKQNFLINNVTKGVTTKGSAYYNVVLQDASGTIEGKKWEIVDGDENVFKIGNIVEIEGDVLLYKGGNQLKILSGKIADDRDVDATMFVQSAPVSRSDLQKQLFEYIEKIEDVEIKLIVEEIIKDNYISFSNYPAASKFHHEYASGLIYHTVSMLKIATALCDIYPSVNRSLLYGGIILHDVGKTAELSGPIVPKYTTQGRLLGHISIIQAEIKKVSEKLAISSEVPVLLQHMVLSHHGKYEFGSPVLPMIKEAELLTYIDNIDAKMNIMDKALEQVEEGEFTGRQFALEDRCLYKPFSKEKK